MASLLNPYAPPPFPCNSRAQSSVEVFLGKNELLKLVTRLITELLTFTMLEFSAKTLKGHWILSEHFRPHDKLPYSGAWLWVGSKMIHLMELPNPDPLTGRPAHGDRDRHTCIAIRDLSKLKTILDNAGIPYTLSKSGRPAIFTRDPDANALDL